MENQQLLDITTYAGEILLKNGAEIYRVEETINYIFNSYGVENASAYILTQGIFISYSDNGQTYNKILRITNSSLNIFRINAVNNLSRRISQKSMTFDAVYTELRKIDQATIYNDKILILAAGASSFLFTLFFGGDIIQATSTIPIGMLAQIFNLFLIKNELPNLLKTMFVAAFMTLGVVLVRASGLVYSMDSMIIGCFMLLVPGLSIENAIQDSIRGDYICGMTRALEAFLIAIMIALGSASILLVWRLI